MAVDPAALVYGTALQEAADTAHAAGSMVSPDGGEQEKPAAAEPAGVHSRAAEPGTA